MVNIRRHTWPVSAIRQADFRLETKVALSNSLVHLCVRSDDHRSKRSVRALKAAALHQAALKGRLQSILQDRRPELIFFQFPSGRGFHLPVTECSVAVLAAVSR